MNFLTVFLNRGTEINFFTVLVYIVKTNNYLLISDMSTDNAESGAGMFGGSL